LDKKRYRVEQAAGFHHRCSRRGLQQACTTGDAVLVQSLGGLAMLLSRTVETTCHAPDGQVCGHGPQSSELTLGPKKS